MIKWSAVKITILIINIIAGIPFKTVLKEIVIRIWPESFIIEKFKL